MEERLLELQELLKKCDYPPKLINRGIHNARLQGPAPMKSEKDNVVPFVHQNMSNFQFSHILTTAQNLVKNAQSDEIRHAFKDVRFVEAMGQPKNIIRTITSIKSSPEDIIVEPNPGIFAECIDKRCEICKLGYIQNCTSFITSNGERWEIKSHINCNSRNVVYYLECLMCNGPMETKTGKTKTRLRDRVNNHRSECKSGNTSDVFDRHCHSCGAHRGEEPYFRVRAFMKLSTPDKLLTYEKMLHGRKYATINS